LLNQKLLLGLLGLAGLAGLYYVFGLSKPAALEFSSLVQAQEFKNASSIGGRVKRVYVSEGQSVQENQPLIEFDSTQLDQQIQQSQALLAQATAKVDLLGQAVNSQDIRQAAAQKTQATAQLSLVQHGPQPEELKQAQAALTQTQVALNDALHTQTEAQQLFQDGIISQQKLTEIGSKVVSAQSAYQSANSAYQLLQKGARPQEVSIAKARVSAADAQAKKLLEGPPSAEKKAALAAVEQAKSGVELLKKQRQELILKANMNAVVSVVSVQPGELVPPGRAVISLIDAQHLWADINIPEDQLFHIHQQQRVDITSKAYPQEKFTGRVAYINPKSEFIPGPSGSASDNVEQSLFRVKVMIDPQSSSVRQHHLYPGMSIVVKIPTATND
jgi:multidrug resistance efflux pump